MSNKRLFEANPIEQIIDKALKPTRVYTRKVNQNQHKPEYARFKCKCYYRDGNSSVHYSYDYHFRYQDGQKIRYQDEEQGFIKLLRMIEKRRNNILSAVIWCTFSQDQNTENSKYNYQIAKFVGTQKQQYNPLLQFRKGLLILDKILVDYNRRIDKV